MTGITAPEWSRKRRLTALRKEWPLLLVVAYVLVVTWPLLHADFGMVDDHEIMLFLGPANCVKLADTPRLLQKRLLETNGRFRPGYYALRIGEALLWGGRSTLWYADRILFALIAAAGIYRVCRALIPPFCAAVATLLFFSGPQSEIWYRLGPNETYGIVILSLGLAWLAARWQRGRARSATLLPPLLLIATTGFVKESFIPILPALLLFLYAVVPFLSGEWGLGTGESSGERGMTSGEQGAHTAHSPLPTVHYSVLFLLAAIVAVQVAGTVFMMLKYGHVYAGGFTAAGLELVVRQSLLQYSTDTACFLPALAVVTQGLLLFAIKREEAARRDLLAFLGFLLSGAVLFLVPQWIVYGTTGFGIGGRYLTPGNLFTVYSVVLGMWFLLRQAAGWQARVWKLSIAGGLLALVIVKGVDFYHWSAAFAASTRQFQTRLSKVVELKTHHPDSPLLFTIDNVAAYEPIVSVQRFLTVHLGKPDRPFLRVPEWDTSRATPLEKVLAERLSRIGKEGDPFFRPYCETAIDKTSCIEVSFSGPGQPALCSRSVNIFRD
jgi:hypothetical protein